MAKQSSMKKKKRLNNILVHLFLTVLSAIWLIPIVYVILLSFIKERHAYIPYIIPKEWTFNNYIELFTDTSASINFGQWYINTLLVAVVSCIGSTFLVLSVAYTLSRLRFKMRKPMMNVALVLGMFPGFMSMIAIYYILKGINMTKSLTALTIVYIAGAGLQYYVAKGFFDTIPKAIDEAAFIDGATRFQVFRKITMPLSKPIVVYTILTTFTAPWLDFIFAKVLMGDASEKYTVAVGLFTMLDKQYVDDWYTRFAAGSVCVSIPIAILFVFCQKYYVEGLSGSVKG